MRQTSLIDDLIFKHDSHPSVCRWTILWTFADDNKQLGKK